MYNVVNLKRLEPKINEIMFQTIFFHKNSSKIIIIYIYIFVNHRHCYMEKDIRVISENIQKTFQRTDSKLLFLVCTFDPISLTWKGLRKQ